MFLVTFGIICIAVFFVFVGYFIARLRRPTIETKLSQRLLKMQSMNEQLLRKIQQLTKDDSGSSNDDTDFPFSQN